MTSRPAALVLLVLYALIFLAPGFFTLPPLDRDEARFAQATKQMMETGDFVEIRFQDAARNKKPVGIYWMQAASAEALGGPEAAPIWAYRIPSAIGALLAIVFTYLAGVALVGKRAAAIGAVLFGISVLMVAEGHIGKTDAMMCAAIAALQAGLARAFMGYRADPAAPARWSDTLMIWLGLGVGALIKGPVGLMVGGTTVLALWLLGGGIAWLKKTRPAVGIVLALAIVLPWAIAITLQTGWSFWYDAVFGDMLSKVVSGQERHGGFPGYYLLLATLTLFPGSLLLLPAAWRAVQSRKQDWARFLIAWALPTWLIFEILPTKLPHYVLPIYPALALAIGAYAAARMADEDETTPRWARIANLALWGVIALVISALFIVGPQMYAGGIGFMDIVLAMAVFAAASVLLLVLASQTWRLFVPASVVLMALIFAGIFERTAVVAQDIQVSQRLAESLRERAGYTPGMPIAATGYHEPSLVFLTATDIALVENGAAAAAFLRSHPGGLALVEDRQLEGFVGAMAAANLRYDRLWSIDGLNYSRGQKVKISIFRLRPPK